MRLALVLVATTAAAAPPPCTTEGVKQVRKRAEALVKAKQYQAAVDELNTVVACYIERDQPADLQAQLAWRLSDLTWALHKAGSDNTCYGIAAREVTPYAGNAAAYVEDQRVLDALQANADVCYAAEIKRRGKLEPATKCTLTDDAFGVPTSALLPGDRAACLLIGPGGNNEEEMLHECGSVTLVRRTAAGRITWTQLALPEGSNLTDGSVCCNLTDVRFARHGNALAFFASTGGRNCDGGTASSSEEQVYELGRDAKTATIVHSLDVGYH